MAKCVCKPCKRRTSYERPSFLRQLQTCLYKQWLSLIQSPQSYIIVIVVPILTALILYLIQTAIYAESNLLTYVSHTSDEFVVRSDLSNQTWPSCKSIPKELIQKPCIDLAVCLQYVENATELDRIYEVLNLIIRRYQLENVKMYEDCSSFYFDMSDVLRDHDTIVGISFNNDNAIQTIAGAFGATLSQSMINMIVSLVSSSYPGLDLSLGSTQNKNDRVISLYAPTMRYSPTLTPATQFLDGDINRNFFLPIFKSIYEAFAVIYQGEPVDFELPYPEVVSWPHKAYKGFQPITMLVGTLVTLSSIALLSLLASMLLSDLSHPCSSLMTFLGLSVPARILAWVIISLPVTLISPTILYICGLIMGIPLYSEYNWKIGYAPLLVFSFSLIPTALIISVACSHNIAYPALPTNNPTATATYIIGILALTATIILAPISSTVFKTSEVHSTTDTLNSLFNKPQESKLPVVVTSYILRQLNFAVGLACCSLGIIDEERRNTLGLPGEELWWVVWDMVWMTLVAILIIGAKILLARQKSKACSCSCRNSRTVENDLKAMLQKQQKGKTTSSSRLRSASSVHKISDAAHQMFEQSSGPNGIQLEESTSTQYISQAEPIREMCGHAPGVLDVLEALSDPLLSDDILVIKDLKKSYSDFHALNGINFCVRPGTCVCLNGINGSGKSTLMHCLVRLDHLTSGEITFGRTIGFVSQFNTLWDNLNAAQHLRLVLKARGLDTSMENVRSYLHEVGLHGVEKRRVGQFSYGMKRRTCLAMALCGQPALYILDEVTSGVDPGSKELIWGVIQRQLQKQAGVLLSTHSIRECEVLASKIIVIGAGKVAAIGSATELKQSHPYGYSVLLEATKDATSDDLRSIVQGTSLETRILEAAQKCASQRPVTGDQPKAGTVVVRRMTDSITMVDLPKLPQDFINTLYVHLQQQPCIKTVALRSPSLEPIFNEYAALSARRENGMPVSL
ncbi:ABC transporter family protein [Giardia muris]|uniref:ABC transporter family protein n=1 Tax=Giardia muris TaxID=5742 RepID=A0A4Z1SQ45_GIAMU|nr:ABC transporter family protein [Giardia muris]|eukprot:TNJ27790.1 ABC transporter family protein [Giardia muris]